MQVKIELVFFNDGRYRRIVIACSGNKEHLLACGCFRDPSLSLVGGPFIHHSKGFIPFECSLFWGYYQQPKLECPHHIKQGLRRTKVMIHTQSVP